ncbi:YdcF family protein [Megamonas hypermegale]|uniref:YdcF family protein n=1 Tax=Megamonas hypermegale TaxID=158847 RepID=UPI00195995A4|nr:YdcF family protein [Megamonas hypermegale]MBM6833588.1 YdcF family protein [Megamonas hypermegale]
MLYKVFYSFIMPPGGIISLLILFNIYLYWKKIKGKFILTGIILLFYILSMQFTAFHLMKPLENTYTNYSIEELKAQNPDVIIMLGGGAINNIADIDGDGQVSGYVANRMITVMRLQNELDIPVILSGGKVFEDTGREADIEQRIFKGMGMPENMMLLENESRNTVENARNSKVIMQGNNFTKPILITSGFHMPRSMMIFEREGINPVPYVTDYQLSGELAWSIFNFIPNSGAFNNSCMAIREYMGILALRLHLQ